MSSGTLLNPEMYQFPVQKLRRQTEPGKIPLVLVACGSFSPPTYLHLRLFSMASDYVRTNTNYELVGGYMSPVSDAYKKAGLAPAIHRLGRTLRYDHIHTLRLL
jgi:nicotinamide mononucleotide adenylyltransferase